MQKIEIKRIFSFFFLHIFSFLCTQKEPKSYTKTPKNDMKQNRQEQMLWLWNFCTMFLCQKWYLFSVLTIVFLVLFWYRQKHTMSRSKAGLEEKKTNEAKMNINSTRMIWYAKMYFSFWKTITNTKNKTKTPNQNTEIVSMYLHVRIQTWTKAKEARNVAEKDKRDRTKWKVKSRDIKKERKVEKKGRKVEIKGRKKDEDLRDESIHIVYLLPYKRLIIAFGFAVSWSCCCVVVLFGVDTCGYLLWICFCWYCN